MYYQTEIVSNKNNLRKVRAIIKPVINRKKSPKTHDKFMYNNRDITDPQIIADGFNNYFVNIGPTLASKFLITIIHTKNSYLKTEKPNYS